MGIPLALVLGALGRRIAGGLLNQWAGLAGGVNARVMGDTPARLIYAALMALVGLLGGMSWQLSLPLILAVWIGTTTGNTGIAMGRGGVTTFAQDWWASMLHGLLSALPVWAAAGYFMWHEPWRLFLMGLGFLTCAVWYEMAWDVTGLTGKPKWPVGFQTGSDLAEALWGGACALCLFAACVP